MRKCYIPPGINSLCTYFVFIFRNYPTRESEEEMESLSNADALNKEMDGTKRSFPGEGDYGWGGRYG